jgi:hypothetical protein
VEYETAVKRNSFQSKYESHKQCGEKEASGKSMYTVGVHLHKGQKQAKQQHKTLRCIGVPSEVGPIKKVRTGTQCVKSERAR